MTGSITGAPGADLSQSPGLDTSGGPGVMTSSVSTDTARDPPKISSDDGDDGASLAGQLHLAPLAAHHPSPVARDLTGAEQTDDRYDWQTGHDGKCYLCDCLNTTETIPLPLAAPSLPRRAQ